MMNWLYKYRFTFFVLTAVIFIAGMFMGFGSYIFIKSPQDTALKVNGARITIGEYEQILDQLRSSFERGGKTATEAGLAQLKRQAVQEAIRQEVFSEEAKQHGIHVVDDELRAYIESIPAFQKDGHFDQDIYLRTIRYNLHMTPEKFEAARRQEIAFKKLELLIGTSIQIPNSEFPDAAGWYLSLIKDPKERKKIADNPRALRNFVHNQEIGQVMARWLAGINSKLRVKIVSADLKNL